MNSLFYNLRLHHVWQRSYSRYSPKYVEPVYHPNNISQLSPEELKSMSFSQVKAATTSQNASVFHDPLLAKFTNHVMMGGRKAKARAIISEAFEKIKKKQIRKFHLANSDEAKEDIKTNPLTIFHEAIKNCKPLLDITHVKRGGGTYKVPIPISDHRSDFIAMKWMIEAAREHEPRRQHQEEYFSDRLAQELLSASINSGKVVKRKIEHHKVAEANKAYAHYRWRG